MIFFFFLLTEFPKYFVQDSLTKIKGCIGWHIYTTNVSKKLSWSGNYVSLHTPRWFKYINTAFLPSYCYTKAAEVRLLTQCLLKLH